MSADPIEVKLTIFPAFPYTSDDIETFIKLYHEFGIAYYYEVDGKPYLAVNPDTWLKYQTYIRKDKLEKQKSKIPEPKDAPWLVRDNTADDLATKNVAKQQSATINVLSPSPSPSPPLYKDGRYGLLPGWQWLTSNPDFNQQWANSEFSTLPYDRTAHRLNRFISELQRPSNYALWGPETWALPPDKFR